MPSRRGVYLDACCFIEAVKHDIGIQIATNRQHDVWHYKQLMQANRDGEIEVCTSVLSIAECSHAGGDVSDAVKSMFKRMLLSGQYVRLVQPTPMIGETARDFRWLHGMSLKGADALHLASAIDRSCEEFITLDSCIRRIGNAEKFAALGLRLIEGRSTGCLPDKYRQSHLDLGTDRAKEDDC
jgi:hypothetical protein